MFYQDLVNVLSNCAGGIQINNESYNIFCYEDYLILTSLSVTGLQTLINTASRYIVSHGLNFHLLKPYARHLEDVHLQIHHAGN